MPNTATAVAKAAALVRRNQKTLSQQEWADLISAINATHGAGAASPAYRQFVQVHVDAMSMIGMSWGVHSMGSMRGRNFLAWHRWFLVQFEKRLRKEKPNVTIPYWDWIADPEIPQPLSDPALLASWSVTRDWDASQLPIQADVDSAFARATFAPFQPNLEDVHNAVHRAVGGVMATASSPADPLFFLHHSNVDRLWSEWAKKHPNALPPNVNERLQPKPLFNKKVSEVVSISALGYRYA